MTIVDEIVERIDIVYESRRIYTAIIVSDDLKDRIYDSLKSRMYPCLLMSDTTEEDMINLPNKTIICSKEEYTSDEASEFLSDVNVDCVFFIGFHTFAHCVNQIMGKQKQQFIFTL